MKWWRSQKGMLQQEHLTVKTDLTLLNQVLQWFEEFCLRNLPKLSWLADRGDRAKRTTRGDRLNLALDELKLALDEGFTNVVRHAHEGLPPETPIDIDLTLWDDRLEIRIWDRGEPFNPDTIAEPSPGTLQVGGYGWFLLRRLVDEVAYQRYQDDKNCLLLVKRKPK